MNCPIQFSLIKVFFFPPLIVAKKALCLSLSVNTGDKFSKCVFDFDTEKNVKTRD
jgi:hypothetical protein